jgi:carboxylesterase
VTTLHTQQSSHNQATQPVVGALLVHGLNGSRSDMAELDDFLTNRGILTVNMLLPGHGLRVQDLLSTGWEDWAQAVREELSLLKERCDVVFLVGHSLGGALVLHVAAHNKDIAGIVVMCAPLHLYPWLKHAVGIAKYITPLLPTVREDVRDPEARRHTRDVYRWTPMRPVESMLQYLPKLREELSQVTMPALIMTALHDHVVPARDSREIYRRIGSREKHLVTLHRSYHVIMKDHDRQEVFDKTLAFILRHAPNTKTQDKKSSIDQTA